jgi:methylenetetrahydrofolate reductase (NADPH)
MSNTLPDAIRSGRFVYVVELVASALKREAQVLEIASKLAVVPDIVAGSITSYAGGRFGQDSVRVGTAVRARGLTPNVHLTCVNADRAELGKTLRALEALEMHNVFAITGDYPKETDASTPVFDVDSVQLIDLIARLRREQGIPFFISAAVSPFKYVREDCLYQYLKLEKKIAAGADMAITQVGWDARKFIELKRYLDERGVRTPVLGNVYVLGRRAAEKMAGGSPPGCWASPELVQQIQHESQAPDGGLKARLERAAISVAILKGLGYAGAYLGGTHDVRQIKTIIARAEELAPRWQDLVADLSFGKPDGFYLYDAPQPPRPHAPILTVTLDALGRTLPVPWAKTVHDSWLRGQIRALFAWADRRGMNHTVEKLEYAVKRPMFGCEECGNCVLGHMEYVCPQTCPKQMRNGPCGGTLLGRCEVVDKPCIWVNVMARAEATDNLTGLKTFIPPPDRGLKGTSSYINFYLGRDSRPGSPKPAPATQAAASSKAEGPPQPVTPFQ